MAVSLSLVLLCVAVVHQSCQQSSQQLTNTTVASTSMPILIIMATSDFSIPTVTPSSLPTTPSSMTLGPVLTQTRASLSTLLPTTSSVSMTDLFTLPPVLPSSHPPSSSRSPSPSSEPPTESSPSNVIEFVKKYPVATSMVGATVLFLTCTLACLGCAIFYRKRRLRIRRMRRPPVAHDSARDEFIVNPVALQAIPPNRTLEDSTAPPNINRLQLRGVLNEALIVSNPQAESSFVSPRYHATPACPHPSAPPKYLIKPQQFHSTHK